MEFESVWHQCGKNEAHNANVIIYQTKLNNSNAFSTEQVNIISFCKTLKLSEWKT